MSRFRTMLAMLLCVLPLAAMAQDPKPYPDDVAQWVTAQVPSTAAVADRRVWLLAANGSPLDWEVTREGGSILAKPYEASLREAETAVQLPFVPKAEAFHGAQQARKVSDGWLVVFNRGEFGGALYWFSPDGERNYRISPHQVVDFFLVGKRLHAVEGLAHLGLSRGSVIALDRVKGQWQASTVAELPAAPYAVAPQGGAVHLVLSSSVVTLRDGRIETVLPETPWDMLYPTSAAFGADGRLYVGLRQYVARADLAAGKLEFLVPDLRAVHRLPVDQEQQVRLRAEGR
ncbi:hypothetical protein [Arenimonas sp. MALMAid1274]|uniref:hypothetical protein n=1 Tax=Arenimonas sp. MALMAid1274 TaxID=3411630 RepID=UPI003BA187B4